jgi:hypothetical protein
MATDYGSAEVKQRGGDILIVAQAMLGAGRITDWDTFKECVSVADIDANLGATLRLCLLRSRKMPSEWMRAHMGSPDYNERLARAFGLKSSKSLFPGMKNVSAELDAGRLVLGPSRNRRGGRFDGFEVGMDRGHEDLTLPFSATNEEVGLALREALRRCL